MVENKPDHRISTTAIVSPLFFFAGVTGYCERLTVVNGHLGWGNEGVISEQANVICDEGYMLNEKITCEFFSRVRGIWSNGVTHITCVRKCRFHMTCAMCHVPPGLNALQSCFRETLHVRHHSPRLLKLSTDI